MAALARKIVRAALACLMAILMAAPASFARGDSGVYATGGAAEIAVSDLPREAQETLRLIERGGPFPYQRDGVVFGNFEKRCGAGARLLS
jgi:ribonuclease T1